MRKKNNIRLLSDHLEKKTKKSLDTTNLRLVEEGRGSKETFDFTNNQPLAQIYYMKNYKERMISRREEKEIDSKGFQYETRGFFSQENDKHLSQSSSRSSQDMKLCYMKDYGHLRKTKKPVSRSSQDAKLYHIKDYEHLKKTRNSFSKPFFLQRVGMVGVLMLLFSFSFFTVKKNGFDRRIAYKGSIEYVYPEPEILLPSWKQRIKNLNPKEVFVGTKPFSYEYKGF